jgi:hypothetical protein
MSENNTNRAQCWQIVNLITANLSCRSHLTISDLQHNPNVVWHRGLMNNFYYDKGLKREVDSLASPNPLFLADIRAGKIDEARNRNNRTDIRKVMDSHEETAGMLAKPYLRRSLVVVGQWPTLRKSYPPGHRLLIDVRITPVTTGRASITKARLSHFCSVETIERNLDCEWDIEAMLNRSDITIALIVKVAEAGQVPIPWDRIGKKCNLVNFTDTDKQRQWDRSDLSLNRSLTLTLISEIDTVWPAVIGQWNWSHISRRACLTVEEVRARLVTAEDRTWSRFELSYNPSITRELCEIFEASSRVLLDRWDERGLSIYVPLRDILYSPHIWRRPDPSTGQEISTPWSKEGILNRPTSDVETWFRSKPHRILRSTHTSTAHLSDLAAKLKPVTLYRHDAGVWPLLGLCCNNKLRLNEIYRLCRPEDRSLMVLVGLALPTDRKLRADCRDHYLDLTVITDAY